MSRLTELLRQVRKADTQLGADLEAEVSALKERRSFGLVFERHQPEAVELAGRPVRRGDKVRALPPRSDTAKGDQRLWVVEKTESTDDSRIAHLVEAEPRGDGPTRAIEQCDNLVVVAEFRDRIYPGLVETGRVENGEADDTFHTVINAENYHALEMLAYTHRQSIDVIYIDPPYNTGAKDWKYNNDYVAAEDDYRHSKWLSFMERRLLLAKELLNPEDSVLIVTIDEKEYLRLGMLLEQVFPEADMQMVSSMTNKKGSSRPGRFSRAEEYLFFLYFGEARVQPTGDNMIASSEAKVRQKSIWNSLLRRGDDASRVARPNMFYPVWVDPGTQKIVEVGDALPVGEDRSAVVPPAPGLVPCWPLRSDGSEGRWQVGAPRLRELLAKGFAKSGAWNKSTSQWAVLFLKSGQITSVEKGEIVRVSGDNGISDLRWFDAAAEGEGSAAPRTLWVRDSHDASIYGSTLLRSMLPGRKFPFPKSLYAVEDTLRFVVKSKPDATILDFFSGSGTTAHAVMRLNKQDRGRRRCVSVTNNEVGDDEQARLRKKGLRPGDAEWEALGICDYVTKPRIRAAITGKAPEGASIKGDYKFTDEFPISEGFKANAAFFTLTYEDPLSVRHHRAFTKVAPMLWMRAGSRGRIIDDLGERGWDVAEAYGVIERVDQMDHFVRAVADVAEVQTVFVVTDSDAAFQSACRDLPDRVTTVRLYESYLHNFTINRRAGA